MWWIRHKESGDIIVLNRRTGATGLLGERVLGYLSRKPAVNALMTSGYMTLNSILWEDLELVNGVGQTMEDMEHWPVEAGYAIKHREGWYWRHAHSGRVWYSKPGVAETAWKIEEAIEAASDHRKPRNIARAQFVMVRGLQDGTAEELPNWLIS